MSVFERQQAASQPDTLTRLVDQVSEALPAVFTFIRKFDLIASLLPQYVAPVPSFQLTDDFHGSKFTVPDQQNGDIDRNQALHVSQEGQLLGRRGDESGCSQLASP